MTTYPAYNNKGQRIRVTIPGADRNPNQARVRMNAELMNHGTTIKAIHALNIRDGVEAEASIAILKEACEYYLEHMVQI